MKGYLLIILLFLQTIITTGLIAQSYSLSGKIYDAKTKEAIYYAAVNLEGTHMYDLTNEDGVFLLDQVKKGNYTLIISVLGYKVQKHTIKVNESKGKMKFFLQPLNLSLNEVTVTAQSGQSKEGSTTYKIGDQAIQQIQPISVSDILQLIPGNQVTGTNLNTPGQVQLRSASDDESTLNSFGTAIIIDGNQLSNDGNMQAYNGAVSSSGDNSVANKGIDLRDIPASNIESVEVVSGVASAKYGNISSGAVLIKRKAGYTPLRISFNTTPSLYQFGLNKGFKLRNNAGFLNIDGDYTYSNNKNISRQNYYQRVNFGSRWTKEVSKKWAWINTLSFSYAMGFDGERMDPDETIKIVETENKNNSYRFSNHGNIKIFGRTNYSLSINYTDQYLKKKAIEDGPIPIIESLEEGTYFTTYTPIQFNQSTEVYGAPLNINGRIDTEQLFRTGILKHSTNLGVEYTYDKNYGKGRVLADDGQSANLTGAGTREANFYNVPASIRYAAYLQDDINYKTKNVNYLLKIGARYNYMLEKYHLLSPRLSFSSKIKDKYRFRAAYGLSYKAPSMLQLYPGPVYFDIINLNHYTNDVARQMAVVTTYIHQPNNEHLKPYKGETIETGVDLEFEEWNIKLTAYKKTISDGITSYSELKSFEKEKWEVTQEYEDRQPDVAPTGNTSYVVSTLNVYANAQTNTTQGIELSAQLPKIKITNTKLHLSGNYLKSNTLRDVPTIKSSTILNGATLSRYGVYENTSYNTYESRANLTIIQHIPEIKLMVTLINEANFIHKKELDRLPSIYPTAYYKNNGEYVSLTEAEAMSDEFSDLVSSDSFYEYSPTPTYFNFHLQIRKETRQGHSFSFYANNFLWHNPSFINKINNSRNYLNSRVTFGFGINFKL